jgi:hypothetical protein
MTDSEFKKFDAAMRKVLSVSHEELKAREAQSKKEKARKRTKKSASRASSEKD